jgi:hypothetical protein
MKLPSPSRRRRRIQLRDRQVLTLDDFTEADVAALEQTRAPDSSKIFDAELEVTPSLVAPGARDP